MKKIIFLITILAAILILCGCDTVELSTCVHEWESVKCTEVTYCKKCGVENPDLKSENHRWVADDCTVIAFCDYCGVESTEVINKEHTFMESTCLVAGRCMYCNVRNGEPLGHDWVDATCKKAKYCARCKKSEGARGDHDYTDPTCTESGKCSVCGISGEKPLGHTYSDFKCIRCDDELVITTANELSAYLNDAYKEIHTAIGTVDGVKIEVEEHTGLLATLDMEILIDTGFFITEHNASVPSIINSDALTFEERIQAFVDVINVELEIIEIVERFFPDARFTVEYFQDGYNYYWWGKEYWSRRELTFRKNDNGEWYMYELDSFLRVGRFSDKTDEIYRAVSARFDCDLQFSYFSDRYQIP